MFHLRAPPEDVLRALLAAQRDRPFSYAEVGATRRGAEAPPGYVLDHSRARLGAGTATFERAVAAVRRWTMFDLGWVRLFPPDAPIETGTVVAPVARVGLFHVVNVARIVYTIDDAGPPRRSGFAYGTLEAHVERGEERFTIEYASDGSVWYDILAFSRPNHALVRLGYPLARALQRRFARGSMRAMLEAVS